MYYYLIQSFKRVRFGRGERLGQVRGVSSAGLRKVGFAATTAAARFCSRAADFSGVEAFLDGVVAGGTDDGDFGVIVRGGGEEDESVRAQGFE